MDFMKGASLIFMTMFVFANGHHKHEQPNFTISCGAEGLSVIVSFKDSFDGVIFADGYYSEPRCRSPDVLTPRSKEVKLTLPLIGCDTKVLKNRGSTPTVQTTLVIQHHPMIKTIFDAVANVSCRLSRSLSRQFWTSYRHREKNPPPRYHSWTEFKLGNQVLGEHDAKIRGVSNKLFLVVHVKDGGKHKDFTVRNCFAYNEEIIGENTTVLEMRPPNSSALSSLTEFTLLSNSTVSDIMAYAEIKSFHIRMRGKLFIKCGIDLCEKSCLRNCAGIEKQSVCWRTVDTHMLRKRSANDPDPVNLRNLENRNILLRSTVKALSEKLMEMKLRLEERGNNNFERRALNGSEQKSTINYDSNPDVKTVNYVSTSQPTQTELSTLITVGKHMSDVHILNSSSFNVPEYTSEEPLSTKSAESAHDTTGVLLNVTRLLSDFSNDSFTTVEIPLFYEFTTNNIPQITWTLLSNDALMRNKSNENVTIILSNTKTVVDCVPGLKFLVVTITLSLLSACLFVVCIGMLLHIRKERKKHALDTFLLYNFYD